MEREILFRGLRVDRKDWIYGDLQQNFDCFKIREKEVDCIAKSYVVIPESVGQFTGLTDKNGVKIFEGDKLKDDRSHGDFSNDIIEVRFVGGVFCYPNYGTLSNLNEVNEYSEIIGNIHENK